MLTAYFGWQCIHEQWRLLLVYACCVVTVDEWAVYLTGAQLRTCECQLQNRTEEWRDRDTSESYTSRYASNRQIDVSQLTHTHWRRHPEQQGHRPWASPPRMTQQASEAGCTLSEARKTNSIIMFIKQKGWLWWTVLSPTNSQGHDVFAVM